MADENPARAGLERLFAPVLPVFRFFNRLTLGNLGALEKDMENNFALNKPAAEVEEKMRCIQILNDRLQQSVVELDRVKAELAEERRQHQDAASRQVLIARLLAARSENAGVAEYFRLLNEDFMAFANQEDAFSEEAAAILELQEIGDELKVVGAYPHFYRKKSLAVAGGFSAGKSEFISALFADSSIRLPSSIEPTTAIPVYAMNGDSVSLIASSLHGGTVDLLQVDGDFHHKLTHDFVRSFGFNLKSIMPSVFLSTPMPYENLCLIDTPGYNPGGWSGSTTSDDVRTAEEFAHNADALLWLIGLDANGTISDSDIKFLDRVRSDKPLYIVLNKADCKIQSDLEEILDEVRDTLNDFGIDVKGISAYSAVRKKEFACRGMPLADFMKEMDAPSNKRDLICQRLDAVREKYHAAIKAKIKECRRGVGILKKMELDLLESGVDEMERFGSDIQKLKRVFQVDKYERSLDDLENIFGKMEAAVDGVFGLAHRKNHVASNSVFDLAHLKSHATSDDRGGWGWFRGDKVATSSSFYLFDVDDYLQQVFTRVRPSGYFLNKSPLDLEEKYFYAEKYSLPVHDLRFDARHKSAFDIADELGVFGGDMRLVYKIANGGLPPRDKLYRICHAALMHAQKRGEDEVAVVKAKIEKLLSRGA